MTPISEMHKLGWIQIDPDKPINEQVAVGDYVISTEMFVFNNRANIDSSFDNNKFENKKKYFIVTEVDDQGIIFYQDSSVIKEDLIYFNIWSGEGIFFVLKAKVTYVNVKVPDFMLGKVKQLGGIEI